MESERRVMDEQVKNRKKGFRIGVIVEMRRREKEGEGGRRRESK